MSNRVSKQVMELIDELAEWFGEEMMRLEERDIPNTAGREQRLREHTIIAKSNIAMLLDDIRRARQKGKNATR
tara:strand:+ start:737 stop:955 length:219 start_codon:yes stop_codon:yes gene_type:complete